MGLLSFLRDVTEGFGSKRWFLLEMFPLVFPRQLKQSSAAPALSPWLCKSWMGGLLFHVWILQFQHGFLEGIQAWGFHGRRNFVPGEAAAPGSCSWCRAQQKCLLPEKLKRPDKGRGGSSSWCSWSSLKNHICAQQLLGGVCELCWTLWGLKVWNKGWNPQNFSFFVSPRYQRRVQWAKSVLQEQGLDDCSITKVLENYTKPLGLPFSRGDEAGDCPQTGDSCPRGGPKPGNAEVSRKPAGTEGAQSAEGQNGGSQEGGEAALDAGGGSRHQEQENSREMAEGCCHRDLCGCEVKQSPEQRPWEGLNSRECAPEYVLVQEEEEGSSCPEDDSTHAQENVRKRVLIF